MDREAIVRQVRGLLLAIGEDPDREGLRRTPERVADMFREIFSGLGRDAAAEIDAFSEQRQDGPIVVKDITFFSHCEHHLVPFFGHVHLAYLPDHTGLVAGPSAIGRAVDVVSRRPQVQERLTAEIADAVDAALQPSGVMVLVEAEHFCMSMRGVRKPGTHTLTTCARGRFRDDATLRAQVMSLIGP